MPKQEEVQQLQGAMLAWMKQGTVAVPSLLLQIYKKLKLTDVEAMVLIQLLAFTENERKEFPTPEEIQARLTATAEVVMKALQKLLKEQWINIEERVDPISNI